MSKSALSWHQVSTKLGLDPKELKDILEFYIDPKDISKICKKFGRLDRTKFRNKYINLLLQEGLGRAVKYKKS